MVVYEVTAQVRDSLCDVFERYMRNTHIPDVLSTGAFVSADFESSVTGRYRVRYKARNREALNEYLKTHASRLRAEFQEHFRKEVELSREEWQIIDTFG
jgi:hypothetical protein